MLEGGTVIITPLLWLYAVCGTKHQYRTLEDVEHLSHHTANTLSPNDGEVV